jgi:dolichol kinase
MIINTLEVIGLYLLVFIVAEVMHRFGVVSIVTRKFAHLGAAVVSCFLPIFVTLPIAITIGLVFAVILGLAKAKGVLTSIHKDYAGSVGSIMFPLGLVACGILFWNVNPLIFQGSVLVLGLGDGFGGLYGRYFGKRQYRITGLKTWEGSLVFFVLTLAILTGVVWYSGVVNFNILSLAYILLATLFVTFVEGFFSRGWDNLFVPMAAGLALYLLL